MASGATSKSGKRTLAFTGDVTTRSEFGVFGTLLLDPFNIEINNTGPTNTGPGPTFTPGANNSIIDADEYRNCACW